MIRDIFKGQEMPRPEERACVSCGAPDSFVYRTNPGKKELSPLAITCKACWQGFKTQDHVELGCPPLKTALARQADAWIKRIDLSAFPLPLRLHVDDFTDRGRGVLVSFEMMVRDREGSGVYLNAGEPMTVDPRMSETAFYQAVRKVLQHVVLHELDESFRVDGKLRFDPHQPMELYAASFFDLLMTAQRRDK